MRNADLEKQGDLDLATRAVQGVITYFICVIALFFTSPYHKDFPYFFGFVAVTTCLGSTLRAILIFWRQLIYAWNRRAWQAMFFLAIQMAGAAWGLMMCVSIAHYGFQGWTTRCETAEMLSPGEYLRCSENSTEKP